MRKEIGNRALRRLHIVLAPVHRSIVVGGGGSMKSAARSAQFSNVAFSILPLFPFYYHYLLRMSFSKELIIIIKVYMFNIYLSGSKFAKQTIIMKTGSKEQEIANYVYAG